jgi:hypothetical protein
VPVAGDDRPALGGGERSGGSSGVEDLSLWSGDDPRDRAVAAEHPGGGTGDHGAEPERRTPSSLSVHKGGVVDDDGHVGGDAAGVGQLAGSQGSFADRDQAVEPALRRRRSMFAFSASSGSARTSTRNVSSTADSKLPMDVTLNAGPTVSVAQKQKLNLWTEMTRHETVENDDVK